MRRALPGAAALLLYLAFGAALLWPALFGNQVLSASGSFVREGPFSAALRAQAPQSLDCFSDTVCCFDPWLRFSADAFAADGRIPLWKPTAAAGAPFVGNGQSAVFFPTNLLAMLCGAPPIAHALGVLAKLVAGAFCAWLLAQHLRLSFAASLVCGLAFGFGGFQMGFALYPLSNVSLLLPLLVLVTDRLVLRPSPARAALLAAVAALQFFGGHPETAFHCQVAAFALAGVRAYSLRKELGRAAAWRRLPWVVGALGLGAGLAAVQLWPVLEYMAMSAALNLRRQEVELPSLAHPLAAACFGAALAVALLALRHLGTFARSARGLAVSALVLGGATLACVFAGLHAGLVPTFVLLLSPDWLGAPQHYLGPAVYIGESAAFLGAALPLAALGLLQGRPRGPVLVAGVVALIGLLEGYTAPLIDDLLRLLPVFRLALNARLGLLALLALAVLAGYGIDALGQAALQAKARWRLLLAVLAPTLGALLALTLAVRDGTVRSDDYPGVSKSAAYADARLLPASMAERFFPEEARRAPSEPSKIFYGCVVPPTPQAEPRLIYGRTGRRAETISKPAPVGTRFPRMAEAGLLLFRATVPLRDLQAEPSRVRLHLFEGSRLVAESALMVSPDDEAPRWPFPARPASGTTTVMLLMLAVALGCALLAPVGGMNRAVLRIALPLLVAASLWSFDSGLVPLLPESLHFPPSPAMDLLRDASPDGRMLSLRKEQLTAEIPTAYGIADLRGYDALGPERVVRMTDAALRPPGPDFALLGLMSVRYLVGLADAPPGFTRVPVPVPLSIVENPDFLPRARLVGAAVVEPDDERALALLQDPAFPRARSVVLAGGALPSTPDASGPSGPAAAPTSAAAATSAGTASIVSDRPDRVTVQIDPAAPGWLVLADTDFPGWFARVDGEPREIVRANVAFRAVAVQPGDETVEFRYDPLSHRGGKVVSLLSAGCIAAWGLASLRRPRAAPPRRKRSWRRRLSMLGLSGCLSLVLLAAGAEIAARALFKSPFAAEGEMVGMYQNSAESSSVRTVPGWSGDVTVEGRTVTVQLDELGLRGPPIGPRRPDELRVLCLGDSFTFGYGVADDEAFPAVLQERLAQQLGRPVVAGNAGVPGYGTVEQALCLRRLRDDFDPDLVVSAIYIGNDFLEDQSVSRFVQDGFSVTGPWAELMRTSLRARLMLHSRAWGYLEFRLFGNGSRWALRPMPSPAEVAALAGFPRHDGADNQCLADLFMDVIDENRSWEAGASPVVPRVMGRLEESLTAIRAAAGRARVLVVILPSWWHLQEADRLEYMTSVGLDPAEYRLGLTQERVQALCARLGLPVLDVTPFARALPDPTSLFLRENRHLNVEGHRFVAGLLADAIAAQLR